MIQITQSVEVQNQAQEQQQCIICGNKFSVGELKQHQSNCLNTLSNHGQEHFDKQIALMMQEQNLNSIIFSERKNQQTQEKTQIFPHNQQKQERVDNQLQKEIDPLNKIESNKKMAESNQKIEQPNEQQIKQDEHKIESNEYKIELNQYKIEPSEIKLIENKIEPNDKQIESGGNNQIKIETNKNRIKEDQIKTQSSQKLKKDSESQIILEKQILQSDNQDGQPLSEPQQIFTPNFKFSKIQDEEQSSKSITQQNQIQINHGSDNQSFNHKTQNRIFNTSPITQKADIMGIQDQFSQQRNHYQQIIKIPQNKILSNHQKIIDLQQKQDSIKRKVNTILKKREVKEGKPQIEQDVNTNLDDQNQFQMQQQQKFEKTNNIQNQINKQNQKPNNFQKNSLNQSSDEKNKEYQNKQQKQFLTLQIQQPIQQLQQHKIKFEFKPGMRLTDQQVNQLSEEDIYEYFTQLDLENQVGYQSKIFQLDKKRSQIDQEYQCMICMDDIQPTKEAIDVQLDCNHKFHFDCIKQWLQKQKNCPICKGYVDLNLK